MKKILFLFTTLTLLVLSPLGVEAQNGCIVTGVSVSNQKSNQSLLQESFSGRLHEDSDRAQILAKATTIGNCTDKSVYFYISRHSNSIDPNSFFTSIEK